MAKIFLDAADSITISNNNISVFGSTGTESITIASGVTGTVVDQNTENVLFSGAVSSFKFVQAGNQIKVFSSDGTTLVATVPVQGDADGTALTFTDGTAQAILSGGVMKLGGATVNATTAGAVTPITIDTTVKTPSATPTTTTPTFSVTAGAASVIEGNNATFTVSLSSAQTSATTVNFALAGTGGATLGTDTGTMTVTGATVSGSTLTFPAGVIAATVTVPVAFDSTTETGEGVSLTLSSPSTGTTLGTATTASTALSDPAAPTFTLTSNVVAGTSVQEGKNITFTITPSSVVDKDTTLTVNLTGAEVGAITSKASAADFSAAQTVTFKAGDTAARTALITVVDDSTTEGIEGYKASLLDSSFAEKSSVTGTITDPTTTFVLTGATSVNEDASVTYTVTADRAAPTGGITIPYTLSGNATLGTDYTGSTAATGTITIAAGATTGTLILNAVADNLTEAAAENIIVTLGTPSTGNVTTGTVTTTIADTSQSLAAGTIALTASTASVNEGSSVTYTVTLGTAAATATSIPYTLSGTSTLTSDWTGSAATTGNITVAAGATTGTLTVTTVADALTEGAETLIMTLGTLPAGLTLVTGKGTTTTTINDTSTTVAGSTFTLTTGADSTSIVGTSNNDTYNAVVDQATPANSTISAIDDIAAGGGTGDTLSITGTGATMDVLNGALVSGIETVNIRAATANSLNASQIAGLTAVNANLGAGTVLVTNLAVGASIGIKGNGTVAQGEVAFAPVTAGSAITLNIADGVNQVEANDGITAAGAIAAGNATGTATSATINSTGAANITGVIDLANATLTSVNINAATNLKADFLSQATDQVATGGTVTISGAASLVELTTALDNDIAGINASGLTAGGVSAILGNLTTLTVTGGAGNDTITTGSVLTTGSVNAGTGTADTLVLGANVTHANTASLAAKYTNFETLRVNGTYDMSLISSLTALELSGAINAVTNLTATQAAAVTARADIGATTLTLANSGGTSDVLNLNMGTGLTTAAATNSGILTLSGFETINLKSNAGPTATVGANKTTTITGAIVDTSLTAINLTGNAFVFTDISSTKAVTIDGSKLTGDGAATPAGLTVSGSATAGSTITGSAFVDSFTIGAEGSTYTSSAGNDTFTTTAAILLADGTTDVTVAGGLGTDTLTLTGALTLTDVNFTNVSGMEKLNSTATTAVSYTGLGAAARAAFADGLTITTGTLANDATYTVGAGLYDKAVTLTLVSSGVGNSTADNITITTGAGTDTVSVDASAAWVGSAGATGGQILVSTGAGNDTISVSTSTQLAQTVTAPVSITGGLGADTITSVGTNVTTGAGVLTTTYVVAAGDSLVSAYDSITGFDLGTAGLLPNTLDLAGTGAVTTYAATAATGYTSAELTVAVTVTSGLVVFAGTSAASLTLAQKIAAVQSVVTTNNNDLALFTHGSNSYVFENNTTADTVVELVGVTATNIITANANTAGAVLVI